MSPIACGTLVGIAGGHFGMVVSVSADHYGVKLGNGEVVYQPHHLVTVAVPSE